MKTSIKNTLYILLLVFSITGNIQLNAQSPTPISIADDDNNLCNLMPWTAQCHCDDGIQNYGETGVDCGGNCNPCGSTNHCVDGIQNHGETGVDCGGPDCSPCGNINHCADGVQNYDETGVDCGGQDCMPCININLRCYNGIQDGDETGIDCGGPDCAPCPPNNCRIEIQGLRLNNGNSNCSYLVDYTSVATNDCSPSCGYTYNWTINGSPVATPSITSQGTYNVCLTVVASSNCNNVSDQVCQTYTIDCSPVPTCYDGIQNGNETGIDCGGPDCISCPPNNCRIEIEGLQLNNDNSDCSYLVDYTSIAANDCNSDCDYTYKWTINGSLVATPSITSQGTYNVCLAVVASSNCNNVSDEMCQTFTIDCSPVPTCYDGIQNGNETGIDCGGPDCISCPPNDCNIEIQGLRLNNDNSDCNYLVDYTSIAANDCNSDCDYTYKWTINGSPTETPSITSQGTYDVCLTVIASSNCNNVSDQMCQTFTIDCSPIPTCYDGIQNGNETGIDCGGPDCISCRVIILGGGLQNPNNNGGSSLQTSTTNNFFLYPNPVQKQFTLDYELPNTESTGIIHLMNAQGQRVITQNIEGMSNRQQFDVADLPNGIYFLSVQSEGAMLYQSKVVINN